MVMCRIATGRASNSLGRSNTPFDGIYAINFFSDEQDNESRWELHSLENADYANPAYNFWLRLQFFIEFCHFT